MLQNFKCAQSHHDHYVLNQQSELHLNFLDLNHTFYQKGTPEKGLLQRFEEYKIALLQNQTTDAVEISSPTYM